MGKISTYSAMSALAGTETLVGDQSGATGVATPAQLLTYILSKTKYTAQIGDGSSVSYTVTHNLGDLNVNVTLWRASSPFDEIIADVQHTSTNVITVVFSTAPTTNSINVIVRR